MRSLATLFADLRSGSLSTNSRAVWARLQDRFTLYLAALITLTFLYVIFIYAIPMISGEREGTQIVPGARRLNFAILSVHVGTAIPPLLIGLFAFSERARRFSIRIHRWIGTVYCVCIWISALTGIALAVGNTMGLASRLGFSTLGVLWFVTTYFAYRHARQKNIPLHRQWMIRSFALTLAVVSIRPILMLPMFVEVDTVLLNNIGSWACWVPNLILAELYIRRTNFRGMLLARRKRATSRSLAHSNEV